MTYKGTIFRISRIFLIKNTGGQKIKESVNQEFHTHLNYSKVRVKNFQTKTKKKPTVQYSETFTERKQPRRKEENASISKHIGKPT